MGHLALKNERIGLRISQLVKVQLMSCMTRKIHIEQRCRRDAHETKELRARPIDFTYAGSDKDKRVRYLKREHLRL